MTVAMGVQDERLEETSTARTGLMEVDFFMRKLMEPMPSGRKGLWIQASVAVPRRAELPSKASWESTMQLLRDQPWWEATPAV